MHEGHAGGGRVITTFGTASFLHSGAGEMAAEERHSSRVPRLPSFGCIYDLQHLRWRSAVERGKLLVHSHLPLSWPGHGCRSRPTVVALMTPP